jgi:hypothetical protein
MAKLLRGLRDPVHQGQLPDFAGGIVTASGMHVGGE